jgi:hypothetical protein
VVILSLASPRKTARSAEQKQRNSFVADDSKFEAKGPEVHGGIVDMKLPDTIVSPFD